MKVSSYMTQRLVTVSPEMGARSTFYLMLANEIRHLPVVDDGKLVGIVSDRDLRRPGWVDQGSDGSYPYMLTDDMHVRDLMSTQVTTLRTGDSIYKASKIFAAHRFGALPVVNKLGELVGILSVFDLMTPLEELCEQTRKPKKNN